MKMVLSIVNYSLYIWFIHMILVSVNMSNNLIIIIRRSKKNAKLYKYEILVLL